MDLWTKQFHDMATGKLDTIHKSVHNAPQPTSQIGGSQVKPKTDKFISTIRQSKRFKKRVGSALKKNVFTEVSKQNKKKLLVKSVKFADLVM